MSKKRFGKLEEGQIWTIGKPTHKKFQNGLNRMFEAANKPRVILGDEFEITKVERGIVELKDTVSGTNITVKTQSLGRRIR
jgi:hypothetical protein